MVDLFTQHWLFLTLLASVAVAIGYLFGTGRLPTKLFRSHASAPWPESTGPNAPTHPRRLANSQATILEIVRSIDDRLDTRLSRDQFESALRDAYGRLQILDDALLSISNQLERVRGAVQARDEPGARTESVPDPRSGAATVRTAAASAGDDHRIAASLARHDRAGDSAAEPVESLILARFDEIDRETDRNFSALKVRFQELLGQRVIRIDELDNAVLFYVSKDVAIVYPWINTRLRPRWLPFFDLDRGANIPILKVDRPAILKRRGDDEWEIQQKGYGRNDD